MGTAALISALVAAVPAPGAKQVDSAPIASTRLLGFLPDGPMLLLETRTDGASILKRSTPNGGERFIEAARPDDATRWARQRADRLGATLPRPLPQSGSAWRFEQVSLHLVREPALGGRREVRLVATTRRRSSRGESQAPSKDPMLTVWRMPVVRPVEVGPIWPARDGRTLVIGYGHGGRRGLAVIALRRVRSGLLNLEALDRIQSGDLLGAAELLEQAVAVAPFSGDPIYNLACVHARLGRNARAKAELRIALDIDPARYGALARRDKDLASVREDPAVKRWLRLKD